MPHRSPHGPDAFVGLLARLYARAASHPDALLYTFYGEDGREVQRCTNASLVAAVDAMSGFLTRERGLRPGDVALLVYPPSLDFAVAVLGCMVAGVIPAPVYPPNPFRLEQGLETFERIAEDCGARVALTTRSYARSRRMGQVARFIRGGAKWATELAWVPTDRVKPGQYAASRVGAPGPGDLALLQYTSGATSAPKGVMITHGNLIHQIDANRDTLGLSEDSRLVTWVPQYHDFGLISGLLSVAGGNGMLALFSPLSFVSRPALWIELLSLLQATHTAAPNFGYELAVRKTTPEQRAGWDLRSLVVAMNAAEPVRASTVARFCEAFAVSGFNPAAMNPAYGLAEHTVGVTVGGTGQRCVDRDALARHEVVCVSDGAAAGVRLVGCGRPWVDIAVRIVDPESQSALAADQVGEIWVDSPSKAAGYYGRPELSAEVFEARIEGEPDRGWLRTGDMGFLHDGELYICGRLKDMLILQGRNLYPQDIEDAARGAHERVRPGGLAAFVVDHPGDDERPDELVLLVELRGERPSPDEGRAIAAAVQRAVRQQCEVACASVALGAPGLVLKTTSGKLRRRACRERWLAADRAGAIWHVESYQVAERATASGPGGAPIAAGPTGSLAQRIQLLAAELIGLADPDELDAEAPLFIQGLTSMLAVDLCGRLSEELGRPIPVTALFQHASISALADVIQRGGERSASRGGAVTDEALRLAPGGRVAIIGGGPAGVTAAVELVAKGATVTLFERGAAVGGKVVAAPVDGRTYELGQLLFFPTYRRVLERVVEHGLPLVPAVLRNNAQQLDGAVVPVNNDETVAWARQVVALAGHRADPSASMRRLPEALMQPVGEWLASVGMPPPPVGILDLWTGFGYGLLNSQVPAAYLITLAAMITERVEVALLDGQNADLWTAEVEELSETGAFELHLDTLVERIEPVPGGVQVTLEGGEQRRFDAAILAVPHGPARRILPAAHPAQAHLPKYRTYEYVVTVADVDAEAWPTHGTFFENMVVGREGHMLDYNHRYSETRLLILSQYGRDAAGARIPDAQLEAMLEEDITRAGGRLEAVRVRRRWTYFPHLSSEDLRADTLGALDATQGWGGIILAGSYLSIEMLEHTVAHTQELIRQRVAVVAPDDLFAALACDPIYGPLATSVLSDADPWGGLRLGGWVVRPAVAADRDEVTRLDREEYGWLGEDAVEGPESIAHQIALLNGGDQKWLWVLERDGEMVGWTVLQPTRKHPSSFSSWADATDGGRLTGTFDPRGTNLYLVAAGASGDQPKAAHDLIVLNNVRLMRANGIQTAFCCLGMPGFAAEHEASGVEPEAYMRRTTPDGAPADPLMAFFRQLWPGEHAPPRLLLDGYPPDQFSGGHGVSTRVDIKDPDAVMKGLLVRLWVGRDTLGV